MILREGVCIDSDGNQLVATKIFDCVISKSLVTEL